MTSGLGAVLPALTLGTALACAVVAGVFFAFSAFVMHGLARLPAAQGLVAMQSINVAAVRPVFMVVLFGTALACAALVVVAVVGWGEPRSPLVLVGGLAYLVGPSPSRSGTTYRATTRSPPSSRRAPTPRPAGAPTSAAGPGRTTCAPQPPWPPRPPSSSRRCRKGCSRGVGRATLVPMEPQC